MVTEEEKVRRMISDALSLNTLEAASAADLRRLEQAILSLLTAEREKAAKIADAEAAAWEAEAAKSAKGDPLREQAKTAARAAKNVAAAIRGGDKKSERKRMDDPDVNYFAHKFMEGEPHESSKCADLYCPTCANGELGDEEHGD